MSKTFYSGGFLYDPALKEALLHKRDDQTKNNPNRWAFFGGLSKKGEKPAHTFKREVQEELGIKLDSVAIQELTDYFNPDFNIHRYVFYAKVKMSRNLHL